MFYFFSRRPSVRLISISIAALILTTAVLGVLTTRSLSSDTDLSSQNLETSPLQLDVPATQAELGRLLFFDGRLSGDGSTSCSTCHQPENAWADGTPLSRGYSRGALYFRNTPTLINASKMPLFYWDGRFEQSDISSLIRDHVAEAHFMNLDGRMLIERMRQIPEYEQAFNDLYGGDASYGRTLNALAAFLGTLNSENHPYLRFVEGDSSAFSPQAQAGLELFEGKAGCVQCHSGELLSDSEFHALGVPANPEIFQEPLRHVTFRRFFRNFGVSNYVNLRQDPGLFALTFKADDRGKFRTPSLLEVARTGPYMHNGSIETLEDVVRFYNQGGGDNPNKDPLIKPLGVSEQEVSDLVAFLESLGSEATPIDEPELPEYQSRTLGDN